MTDPRLHADAADLTEDARQLLGELDSERPEGPTSAGECHPAVDVVETSAAVEILVDVPGMTPDMLRVAVRRNTVLVVGAKAAPAVESEARFHLAERGFGRFARVVRVTGAVDARRARAAVTSGLLRISLPRVADRRGTFIRLPVERG